MGALSHKPVVRSIVVIMIACLAVLVLSACLGRSGPGPEALPEPVEGIEPAEEEPTEEPAAPALPGAADLAVWLWNDEGLAPGASVIYIAGCENYDGERSAEGVVLKIDLPEGITFVSSSSQEEPFPPQTTGSTLEYALGTMQPGDYFEIALELQMPAELAPGAEVIVSARVAGSAPDPDQENNYAESVAQVPAPNLAVSVYPSGECGPFAPGRAVSYQVSYGNWSEVGVQAAVLTSTLSSGMTFRRAFLLGEDSKTPLSPAAAGSQLSFDLGALEPGANGDILLEADLDQTLLPDQSLICEVGITVVPGELDHEDNVGWSEEYAQVEGPDAWVEIEGPEEGEIGDSIGYYIFYGNCGTEQIKDITISLELPSLLKDVTFEPEPDTIANGRATWKGGTIESWENGEGIYVDAVIAKPGRAVAKATISTSSKDVDPRNDAVETSAEFVEIYTPVISGPSEARVGAQPVVFGMGRPEAKISLYLAGDGGQPDQLIGTTLVGEDGLWEITPTVKLPQPGWYWFTATQELDGRVSPVTGVGNYYSDEITIDTNSLTVNGQRVGGIDQTIDWIAGQTLTFGARIIACQEPLTPTLQVRYYNAQGLMTNHKKIKPRLTRPDGYVEFDFTVPDGDADLQWQLELGYYCREQAQTTTIGRSSGLAAPQAKISDLWHPECWFGGCGNDDPEPPPPSPSCPGCTPIQRPKKRPKPTDPDGLVYDEAAVQSGAKIAQAIITKAEVTCLQKNAEGRFEPWNALEYSQVNPQVTDAQYPDKVLRPGYYSFLVPPGFYRIQVNAPGFLPYESHNLQVLSTPVTLHVPLRRAPGSLRSGR